MVPRNRRPESNGLQNDMTEECYVHHHHLNVDVVGVVRTVEHNGEEIDCVIAYCIYIYVVDFLGCRRMCWIWWGGFW